jgi:uncharacterized membrane protein
MSKNNKKVISYHALLVVLFGFLGSIAALSLSIEKLAIAKDPNHTPSCSINVLLNCGETLRSMESSVFGFPNTFIGLAGFGGAICLGLVMLFSIQLDKRLMRIVLCLELLSVIFSYWLLTVSAYKLNVLCPWCILSATSATSIWAATFFWALYNDSLPNTKVLTTRIHGLALKGYGVLAVIAGYSTIIIYTLIPFIISYLNSRK